MRLFSSHQRRSIIGMAALLGVSFPMASSATLIIDQHNDALPPFQGFTTPQNIGQSFVPSVANLAAVEIQVNDQNLGDGNGYGVFANIRLGTIAGAILGTTQVVNFPDTPSMPFSPIFSALLELTTDVLLTPGLTYVIDVHPAASNLGSIGVFVTGFNNDGYANGTAIADVLTPNFEPTDLWFRTFTRLPEPATLALCMLGLWSVLRLREQRTRAARFTT